MIVNIYNLIAVFVVFFLQTYIIWPNILKPFVYVFVFYGVVKSFFQPTYNTKFNYFFIFIFSIYSIYTIINGIIFYNTEYRFLYGIYQYIFYVMSIFFFGYMYRKIKINLVLRYFMLIGMLNSVIAIYEFLSNDFFLLHFIPSIQGDMIFQANVGDSYVVRAIGLQGSPLTLGVMCGILALISYHIFIVSNKKYAIFMFILHVVGMICSYSRNSWFAFTLSFIFYNIIMYRYFAQLKNRAQRKKIIYTVGYMILFVVIYFLLNSDSVLFSRIISMGDVEGVNEPSNALRFIIWLDILNIIFDNIYNFLFGLGIAITGNSPDAIMISESGFLKRFVEGGIFMVLLYYSMVIKCFCMGLSKKVISARVILALSIALLILIDDCGLQITEQVNFSFVLWASLGYVIYEQNFIR